jgi:hypothetical protein
VTGCLAAIDLHDHAADLYDEGWRERWRARAPDDYWTGEPDHVVFPWNEPELAVGNEHRGRADDGWRLAPPAWCLKNRVTGGSAVAEVQVLPATGAELIAPEVIWAAFEGATVVASIHDERALRLEGVAARWWDELVQRGDPEAAVAAVAAHYDAPLARVRADLDRLADQLVARQLLRGR